MAESNNRSSEYDRRAAVIECLRAGRIPSEIVNFLGYPSSTVYDIVTRYRASEEAEAGSSTAERKNHDREMTVRTPRLIEQVQQCISDDPSVSMHQLAAKFGVSYGTMRTIIHEDLRYNSYTFKIRQELSEEVKARRVARCQLLLSSGARTYGHLTAQI